MIYSIKLHNLLCKFFDQVFKEVIVGKKKFLPRLEIISHAGLKPKSWILSHFMCSHLDKNNMHE